MFSCLYYINFKRLSIYLFDQNCYEKFWYFFYCALTIYYFCDFQILLTSSASYQSNQICVWDFLSFSPLLQLKDGAIAAANTLCPVFQEYVYVGIKGKPLLHRWRLCNGQKVCNVFYFYFYESIRWWYSIFSSVQNIGVSSSSWARKCHGHFWKRCPIGCCNRRKNISMAGKLNALRILH